MPVPVDDAFVLDVFAVFVDVVEINDLKLLWLFGSVLCVLLSPVKVLGVCRSAAVVACVIRVKPLAFVPGNIAFAVNGLPPRPLLVTRLIIL